MSKRKVKSYTKDGQVYYEDSRIPSVYFHRGCLISGKRGEWWIYDDPNPDKIYKTIDEAKNAIDKFTGGFATSRTPKRT